MASDSPGPLQAEVQRLLAAAEAEGWETEIVSESDSEVVYRARLPHRTTGWRYVRVHVDGDQVQVDTDARGKRAGGCLVQFLAGVASVVAGAVLGGTVGSVWYRAVVDEPDLGELGAVLGGALAGMVAGLAAYLLIIWLRWRRSEGSMSVLGFAVFASVVGIVVAVWLTWLGIVGIGYGLRGQGDALAWALAVGVGLAVAGGVVVLLVRTVRHERDRRAATGTSEKS